MKVKKWNIFQGSKDPLVIFTSPIIPRNDPVINESLDLQDLSLVIVVFDTTLGISHISP